MPAAFLLKHGLGHLIAGTPIPIPTMDDMRLDMIREEARLVGQIDRLQARGGQPKAAALKRRRLCKVRKMLRTTGPGFPY